MKKFKYAFNGLKLAIKEKSIIIQFILGVLAIIGGVIIELDFYEWLAFIICIFAVIGFEVINTCIEKMCDLYSKEKDNRIKIIKDLSSFAVLTISFGSLLVCIFCVIRRLLA